MADPAPRPAGPVKVIPVDVYIVLHDNCLPLDLMAVIADHKGGSDLSAG